MSRAYYNEHDPKAAAWLRALIAAGHIAAGDVDERSIVDVRADDLRGYRQCHFFAGIGVWSYALRLAGWPADRPVWTGSCPCQPFSAAGKGDEFGDERHLWPAWFRLIRESRPDAIFGEQVSSKDALAWFDHVRFDLEGAGYAVGVLDTCAAGVGAPHIRQRLFFVADADGGNASTEREQRSGEQRLFAASGTLVAVADATDARRHDAREHDGGRSVLPARPEQRGSVGGVMGDTDEPGSQGRSVRSGERAGERAAGSASAVNGFWRDAIWLPCRDGKARPTQSGIEPLAHGTPARVVRLRGYGNAINAEQARAFIESYIEGTDA